MFCKTFRQWILVVLFAFCALWCAGCGQSEETSSQESEAVRQTSSPEPSDDRSAAASEISLLFANDYPLAEGITFFLPDDWTVSDSLSETELLRAVSADGTCSVTACATVLPNTVGITEELLVNDAAKTLPESLAETGVTVLYCEAETLSFLGDLHPVLSVSAESGGKTVFQQQLYLLDGDTVLLLTVSAPSAEEAAALWQSFG